MDRPVWGKRGYKLGCGPEPLSLKRLKAESFASALRALVTKSSYRERAEEVARGIAAEDGIMRAIEVIEAQERRDAETLDSGSSSWTSSTYEYRKK